MSKNNGWTDERRKQQAQKIQEWQPWKYSTGARTLEGKRIVSKNAYKGNLRAQIKEISKLLKAQKEILAKIK